MDDTRMWRSDGVASAKIVRLAQDDAVDTLADAERLAIDVLAEAQRQAHDLLARAEEAAQHSTERTHPSVEDLARARHEELLALLVECCDGLRTVLESARPHARPTPIRIERPPASGMQAAGMRTAAVVFDVPTRLSAHDAPALRANDADEEYLVALYHAIAGQGPLERSQPEVAERARPDQGRVEAIRSSAQRSAERAAAERAAMQAEAVERRSQGRRPPAGDPFAVVSALRGRTAGRGEMVVALAERRPPPRPPIDTIGASPSAG